MGRISTKFLENNTLEIELRDNFSVNRLYNIIKLNSENYTLVFTINNIPNKFQSRIGQHFARTKDMKFLDSPVLENTDELSYEMIGKMMLDYLIPNTYFIKSHETKTVYEIKGDSNVES